MLWFKPLLDSHNGIEALAAEIAEDAAATKLVNHLGLKVHLVSSPFDQPASAVAPAMTYGRARHDGHACAASPFRCSSHRKFCSARCRPSSLQSPQLISQA